LETFPVRFVVIPTSDSDEGSAVALDHANSRSLALLGITIRGRITTRGADYN
jgi:hypothetical protein